MTSYLLESDDYQAIEVEVKNIIKKEGFNDATTSIYDIEETTLDNALEDLDTYSFLSEKKIIIIKNIESINQDEEEDHLKHLYKYIENPNSDNLLVIEARKLNGTLKVTKELKKRCKTVELEINSKAYIKGCCEGFNISQEAINLLDEYCLGDITKIKNECDKLKEFKFNEKKITIDDIKEIVTRKLGDSKDLVFQFSRAIALRDRKDALKKFQELLQYNFEPLSIIGLLGSQIRIVYQVKLLSEKRMSDKDIANMLEEKEFRIKKTRELIGLYTKDELLNLMHTLSDIDYKIKTTDTDSLREIELFILNI